MAILVSSCDLKKAEVVIDKPAIVKNNKCSYCGYGQYGGFYLVQMNKQKTKICADCIVLTFDLILGRKT